MKSLRKLIVVMGLLGLIMVPGLATAAQIDMQTQATAANAVAGEGNATIASSALITLMATKEGMPASNLGLAAGNGTSIIVLPGSTDKKTKAKGAWHLRTIVTPPTSAAGCVMAPTQFVNAGAGVYVIRVVPSKGCVWAPGDYQYVVDFGPGKDRRGSVLGELTIP